ncbi:cation:proton antiporter [Streptomyces hoynatensis]|uniref:cation:proton antiporter n=1 Tax=Streptomyces hoynatensis TaxID=1141874 RepID=UPI001F4DCBF0|nr:cation:proton antiporter [Streptomyces hoynatensis]
MSLAATDLDWVTTTTIGGIALVLAVGTLFVALARRLRQPAVIGEIAAGICLGPSLLGLLPGDLPEQFFPGGVRGYLSVVAQIALVLFMFIIGWEFDFDTLRGRGRTTGVVWFSAAALPLSLGVGLAGLLFGSYDTVDGHRLDFADFALFMGTAMSIAAFPVLARIIWDSGLHQTRLGAQALALAALDDLLAWCLLAVVTALATASGAGGFLDVIGWGAVFIAVMLAVVRPCLARLARLAPRAGHHLATLAAAGALGSAYLTSEIGLHPIFGAFVFGLVMPRHTETELLHQAARVPLEHAGRLLLPVFFVVTGLSVDLTSMTATGAVHMLLIIATACLGKLGGVLLSARMSGMGWHESATLGLLMNTRGLTELVILNIGLDLGLLDTELFTAMVMMALVTTAMTSPLLTVMLRHGRSDVTTRDRPVAGGERRERGVRLDR